MMAIFTRLLHIRIVAKSRSLSARNFSIFVSAITFSSSMALRSAGDKLKNAISEAEMKPEQISKTHDITKAMYAPSVGC